MAINNDRSQERYSTRPERGTEQRMERGIDRNADRGSMRRSPYPGGDGVSIADITSAIEKSNLEQLGSIEDLFDDAKQDRLESEQSIIDAIRLTLDENERAQEEFRVALDEKLKRSEELDELLRDRLQAPVEESCEGPMEEVPDETGEALSRIENMIGQTSASISQERDILSRIEDKLDSLEQSADVPPVNEYSTESAVTTDDGALVRIESIVGQSAEVIDQDSEILERSFASLREHTEVLNEIRAGINEIKEAQVKEAPEQSYDGGYQNDYQAPYQNDYMAAQPQVVASVDDTAKEQILTAINDNRSILNMIRQDIISKAESFEEEEEEELLEPEEPIVDTPLEKPLSSDAADRYFKDLEDHVHKENVKCYRNVQAAFTEQSTQSAAESKKTLSSIKLFSILSFAFSALNLLLLAAYILGIL